MVLIEKEWDGLTSLRSLSQLEQCPASELCQEKSSVWKNPAFIDISQRIGKYEKRVRVRTGMFLKLKWLLWLQLRIWCRRCRMKYFSSRAHHLLWHTHTSRPGPLALWSGLLVCLGTSAAAALLPSAVFSEEGRGARSEKEEGEGREGCNFAPAEHESCLKAKFWIAMWGIRLEVFGLSLSVEGWAFPFFLFLIPPLFLTNCKTVL